MSSRRWLPVQPRLSIARTLDSSSPHQPSPVPTSHPPSETPSSPAPSLSPWSHPPSQPPSSPFPSQALSPPFTASPYSNAQVPSPHLSHSISRQDSYASSRLPSDFPSPPTPSATPTYALHHTFSHAPRFTPPPQSLSNPPDYISEIFANSRCKSYRRYLLALKRAGHPPTIIPDRRAIRKKPHPAFHDAALIREARDALLATAWRPLARRKATLAVLSGHTVAHLLRDSVSYVQPDAPTDHISSTEATAFSLPFPIPPVIQKRPRHMPSASDGNQHLHNRNQHSVSLDPATFQRALHLLPAAAEVSADALAHIATRLAQYAARLRESSQHMTDDPQNDRILSKVKSISNSSSNPSSCSRGPAHDSSSVAVSPDGSQPGKPSRSSSSAQPCAFTPHASSSLIATPQSSARQSDHNDTSDSAPGCPRPGTMRMSTSALRYSASGPQAFSTAAVPAPQGLQPSSAMKLLSPSSGSIPGAARERRRARTIKAEPTLEPHAPEASPSPSSPETSQSHPEESGGDDEDVAMSEGGDMQATKLEDTACSRPSKGATRTAVYRAHAMRWLHDLRDLAEVQKAERSVLTLVGGELGTLNGLQGISSARRCMMRALAPDPSARAHWLTAWVPLYGPRISAVAKHVAMAERRRLLECMRSPDHTIATALIVRFGSAREAVRASVHMVGETALRRMHGWNTKMFSILAGVGRGRLAARMTRDVFRDVRGLRRATFGQFVHLHVGNDGDVLRLSMDERLEIVRRVIEALSWDGEEGKDKTRLQASWALYEAVCKMTEVQDCEEVTATLLDDSRSGVEVLRRLACESVTQCCRRVRSMSADDAVRLRHFAASYVERD